MGCHFLLQCMKVKSESEVAQSCPTPSDHMDCSLPGSSAHGIFQARVLEWVAISFSNAWKWKVKVKSLSCVRLLATTWTAAHQGPPSMGFSRHEYWRGVSLPSPFRGSAMSNSLQSHGLQYRRLPCPSPTPEACSNSCSSSRWCNPTISTFVIPFSCLQSFPASGSFPMSQPFASGGQSIGVSASASVVPKNVEDWFPLLINYFSKWLYHFAFPPAVSESSFYSTSLSIFGIASVPDCGHLNRCVIVSLCCFNLLFPIDTWCGTLPFFWKLLRSRNNSLF